MRSWHLGRILTVGLVLCAVGCASPGGSNQIHDVKEGTVVRVRAVTLEGSKSAGAALAGGAVGYAVGRRVFRGSGRHVARTATTVGGAAAGSAISKNASTKQGVEVTVDLDDGSVVGVVQEAEVGREFRVGDEVKVLLWSDGSAQVMQ